MSNHTLYQDILDRVKESVPFAAVVLKCKEVTIVAINSLAIETQRNHKLRVCIVKLYGNDGTATVAFISP